MNGKKSLVVFVLFVVVFSSTFAATKSKSVTWQDMKPLQRIEADNVMSVANSSEKKNGLLIAKITEEKQIAIFFTQEEGAYKYPLAKKNNKRLLLAMFDPKTQMIGDGICVEVLEDWKSVFKIQNGFLVVPSFDSKKGNSLVWIETKNWVFKTAETKKNDLTNGVLDWYNPDSPDNFYYYFWDSKTKKIGSFSSETGVLKLTEYKFNNPAFIDMAEKLEKSNTTFFVCTDCVMEPGSDTPKFVGSIYRCGNGEIFPMEE